jgi:peptide/nickel transport system substrate-binding protein
MENRFGVKDFFLFLLVGGLIVLVIVAMFQFDRQYQQVIQIKQRQDELTGDIVAVRRQLAQGITVGGGSVASQSPEAMEVFQPLVKAEQMPGFSRGDWLVDNFGTKIGRLTPLVSTDLYQQWVEARVMEGLVVRDANTLKYVPLLAESWDDKDLTGEWEKYVKPLRDRGLTNDQIAEAIREDRKAPLAQEIVFNLRKGVTFSDGTPLTAHDVVFTFEWIQNPEVNAPRARAYFVSLKEVKANSDQEVVFRFSAPYYGNFEQVGSTSIMSKKFYSRFTPSQFNERTGLLIGTGPYKLEDSENWSPGKPVELVRSVRYWGVPPTFDRLVYREIEDEAAEMVMFGNGELDLLSCVPEQYEKLLKDERIVKMSQHYKYPSPLNGYTYIGWNQMRRSGEKQTPTAFADKRVRQAMTFAIDRERIAREVMLGYATVASGPFDPASPQSSPDVKPWPHDEAKAKSMLKDSGFVDRNGDGVIDGPDGQPFRFKLSYPSGSAVTQRIVLFLKDSFARAGITAEPEPLDWPVLLDRIKRGDYEACMLGWGGVVESDPFQIFHSSQIKDQGDNRTHYINKQLDELIERARRTLDEEARMKLWHQVHQILHEDQPYTFMFNRPSLVFINGRIQNVSITKLGMSNLRLYPLPNPWFVPKNQQRYAK